MLLSSVTQAPSREHARVLEQWQRARRSRRGQWPLPWRQGRRVNTTRRLRNLVGATVVTLIAAGIATWWLWGYRDRKGRSPVSRQGLPLRPTKDSTRAEGKKHHGEAHTQQGTKDSTRAGGKKRHGKAHTEQETEAGVGSRTRSKRKKQETRRPKQEEPQQRDTPGSCD